MIQAKGGLVATFHEPGYAIDLDRVLGARWRPPGCRPGIKSRSGRGPPTRLLEAFLAIPARLFGGGGGNGPRRLANLVGSASKGRG
jgi:hypothetical protein